MYYIGILIVIASVIAGHILAGGHIMTLYQPAEFLIILGAGIGSFLAANRKHTIKDIIILMKQSLGERNKSKKDYIELLCLMYSIFKLARTKSMIAVEPHIETPQTSKIFLKYKSVLNDHVSCNLFCDYVRMISMGVDDSMIIDDLMREEVGNIKQEKAEHIHSITLLADSFPALGIVAAVLGVIHTMGAIDQPPKILGNLIGGALVGTFFGILVSYGIIAPISIRMKQTADIDCSYYECIKSCIIAYLNNLPPIIAVESARKNIPLEMRPDYVEMEDYLNRISDTDL